MVDFKLSPEIVAKRQQVKAFMAERIYPNEDRLGAETAEALMRDLQARAKARGLWAMFIGPETGGTGFLPHAYLNEIIGRSPYAPRAFGCQAPDTGDAEWPPEATRGRSWTSRRIRRDVHDRRLLNAAGVCEWAPHEVGERATWPTSAARRPAGLGCAPRRKPRGQPRPPEDAADSIASRPDGPTLSTPSAGGGAASA